MKYIKNRNIYKINEGWLDDKLKATTSDVVKAIITNWVKPFSKLMDSLKDKWVNIKGEDIVYQFLASLNKSFEFLNTEITKVTDSVDLEDLLSNVSSTNMLLKDEFIKKLISTQNDNVNLNGYSALVKQLFDNIEDNINGITDEYKSKLEETENMEKNKKDVQELFKTLFKNCEEEIHNIDPNSIIEENKDNKTTFKVGDTVKYKKEDFNDKLEVDEQPDNIAEGEVKQIDDDLITIFNKQIGKDIQKNITDIIQTNDNKQKSSDELKSELGKIKDEPRKIKKILDFVKSLDQKPKE